MLHVSGKNCHARLAIVVEQYIGQTKAMIYLDFIDDMNWLTIALREKESRVRLIMETKYQHMTKPKLSITKRMERSKWLFAQRHLGWGSTSQM